MAWKLTVGGVDKTAQIRRADGVSIESTLNERARARFTCLPGYLPARFAEVVIYQQDGTTPLFGGVITTRRTKALQVGGSLYTTDVECADFGVVADWCYHTKAYTTDVTLKAVLIDLVTDTLSVYGITLHAEQVTGPTLAAFEWPSMRASDALRALSERTGYVWSVSPTKVLRMMEPGTETAPYALTDATPHCQECHWADTGDPVVNRVVVLCGPTGTVGMAQTWTANGTDTSWTTDLPAVATGGTWGPTSAYAFLHAETNPDPGDTVTVGGKTYTFQGTLTDVDGNVAIAPTVAVTLESLAAAITLAGGAGYTYAASMTVNPSVSAYTGSGTAMAARALVAGSAGNSIVCTSTGSVFEWGGEGGIACGTLANGYDQLTGFGGTTGVVMVGGVQYSVGDGAAFEWDVATHTLSVGTASTPAVGTSIVLAYFVQGPFEVVATTGATPVIERIVTAETVTTYAAGVETAATLLAQIGTATRDVAISTLDHGWATGQELDISLTARDLVATCIISGVSISLVTDTFWRYELRASTGAAVQASDLQQWRTMTGGGSSSAVAVVSAPGTGGAGVSHLHAHLGGDRYSLVTTNAWTAIPQWVTFRCPVSGSYTYRVESRTSDASVGVTTRLYDLSGAAAVPDSQCAEHQTATWTEAAMTVQLSEGRRYQAQMIGSSTDHGIAVGQAALEL